MFPSTRLQIIRSIITVRATERQTRGFVPANGRRYRTVICSTLSIFNRGPQIYLRRLPRSLHFTIVQNDAIVSYSFFSPFFFYFFSSLSFLFFFSFISETIFFSQWRTVLKGYRRKWIRTSVPIIR